MEALYEDIINTNLHFEYFNGGICELRNTGKIQREWVIRPYDIIICSVHGSMDIFISERKVFIKEGDCIFIPSGQLRRATFYPTSNKSVFSNITFHYVCLNAINFLSLFEVPNVFSNKKAEKLNSLIADLHKLQNSTGLSITRKNIKMKKAGFIILDILMENAVIKTEKSNILCCHSRLTNLLAKLRENPEVFRNVPEMAKTVGVSCPRLYQLFKNLTGYAPLEYRRIQRLNKAAKLLLTTDLTIEEISKQLNYPDQFCFSKSFKKLFSISPSIYRQKKTHW